MNICQVDGLQRISNTSTNARRVSLETLLANQPTLRYFKPLLLQIFQPGLRATIILCNNQPQFAFMMVKQFSHFLGEGIEDFATGRRQIDSRIDAGGLWDLHQALQKSNNNNNNTRIDAQKEVWASSSIANIRPNNPQITSHEPGSFKLVVSTKRSMGVPWNSQSKTANAAGAKA